ncbi:autotransporter domain-containing protein [Mesorhizobium sp. B2-3-4]|uniref:autotransporter domain-containing protein n=1 Tax=Mesorhizobium sp. B2-3-4 TaxID=2589959 RepID=UPI0015E3F1B8|nr:autotransporter domain-containing protein [Mesorhizobium sp. B2-3-4]
MKNRACAIRARALLGGTALFLLPMSPAMATDWTGTTSSNWFNASNWTAGVPGAVLTNIDRISPNPTVVGAPGAQTGTLDVGVLAKGQLTIQTGGTVGSTAGRVGVNPGSTGTVTVTGAGSQWTIVNDLYAGFAATGTLTIQNGGQVHNAKGLIGFGPNATGTVTVDGAGSKWINGDVLLVGDQGTGTLTISNGGVVTSSDGGVGWLGGATGTVTVDGAGSSWTSSTGMVVGGSESSTGGVGSLTITNGAKVANTLRGALAASNGAVGTVKVDGSGSTWTNGSDLTVAGYGTALLSVTNGGKVASDNGYLAERAIGNAAVIVSGAGSAWTTTHDLFVGYGGTGTLIVQDGAAVNVGGSVIIADLAGSTGTLDIGAPAIQAPVATGTLNAGTVSFGAGTGTINFKHSDPAYSFAPKIQGLGTINQIAGNTILTANSSGFTGAANVTGGRLTVDGKLGGSVAVQSGGTLAGSGTVGAVSVANGGTLAGVQGQTLTTGNLTLASASNVNVSLGTAGNTTGLFKVNGNLTLDGALNVADAGGFGQGVYRIIDYTGALTDNGLNVGMMPAGNNGAVQTSVANQVNLVVSVNDTQFWNGSTTTADGTIHGGNGTWIAGPTNWTDANGATASAWGGQFAVFQTNPGTVTVDSSAGAIATTGMQFIGAGWTVSGDPVTLAGAGGNTTIRVGDGTAAGAGYSATIGSELTGASGLVKDDLGTLILTGENSYTGGTIIGAGTLQIGNGGTSGSIAGDVADNGVLAFDRSDDLTFAGTITGSGSVNLIAGGVSLTADSSYTGGTTIASGASLALGNGGTTGSITGDVTDNGELAFVRSDELVFTGAITGSGSVQLVAGLVAVTADNNYTGGTIISGGAALAIGDGGTSGSIAGNVADAGVLGFYRSDDFSFAGVISGTGAISQIGTGTTTLTGDSSSFSGLTNVIKGALRVDGTLGGSVDVQTGARLAGSGTVGDTVVDGTVAPGGSIGTLNVTGGIAFNPGSIYEVEVDDAGQSDKIAATGAATINGGSVKVLAGAGNYAPQTQYTILAANGGRNGQFDTVTSNLAFLNPSLSYDANDVYLTMTRNDIGFQNVGLTPNQIATAGGVESLGASDPIYDAVLNLSADQARYAFDQLSGEIHPSLHTAMLEDSRFIRDTVEDRIRAAFDSVGASSMPVMAYADGAPQLAPATTDRFAVWGQAFGSWGHWNSDGNAARLDRSTGGFLMGADAPIFDSWRFGVVAGYANTSFDVDDRHSSASADTYHLGLYAGTNWGNLAFRSGAAYAWHDVATNRDVAFPGFSDSLKADYDAGTAQVFGEVGYGIATGDARLEPFANLAYVSAHTDGFAEKGGAAALTVEEATTDATLTTLGLHASTSFDVNGATVTAKGTLGWRHAFGDVTPLSTMRFAAGGDPFTIAGVPTARDTAEVEAGFDLALGPDAELDVTYDGQYGSGLSDQSVKATFDAKF